MGSVDGARRSDDDIANKIPAVSNDSRERVERLRVTAEKAKHGAIQIGLQT